MHFVLCGYFALVCAKMQFCVVILHLIMCAKMHTDAHIVTAACRPNTTSHTVTISITVTVSDFAYNFF